MGRVAWIPRGRGLSTEEKQKTVSERCRLMVLLPVFRFKDWKECVRKRKHALKLGKGGNVGCPAQTPTRPVIDD